MNTIKWSAFALLGALVAAPAACPAQQTIAIGNIQRVDDPSATTWAMSGYNIFRVSQPDGPDSPITRTLRYDARTVEILTRTQSPPLDASDVRTVSRNGRYYVVVRRYILAEVRPQDAKAVNMTQTQLATDWASHVRSVLPKVALLPGRFGI